MVGDVEFGEVVLVLVNQFYFAVVLMDIWFLDMNGIEVICCIWVYYFDVCVLMVIVYDD